MKPLVMIVTLLALFTLLLGPVTLPHSARAAEQKQAASHPASAELSRYAPRSEWDLADARSMGFTTAQRTVSKTLLVTLLLLILAATASLLTLTTRKPTINPAQQAALAQHYARK